MKYLLINEIYVCVIYLLLAFPPIKNIEVTSSCLALFDITNVSFFPHAYSLLVFHGFHAFTPVSDDEFIGFSCFISALAFAQLS